MTEQEEMLAIANDYELGMNRALASGYEEFGPTWERQHRLIIAALRRGAQRSPMAADIAQIIKDGWHAGNGPDAVAAEILREFDSALTPADGGGK